MKFKISNILKYIILLFISYLSLYPQEKFKEKKLKIATIDLDNHFKENKPLRKEIVRTINRYHYLKQKMTISVDREKKYLFGTNQLNLKNGLTVASNLNVRIAIIIKSERILITNNTATNKIGDSNQTGTNFGFSNNLKDAFNQIFENYKIVEDTILNNLFFTNNNNTNLSNNLRNEKRYNNNNENEEERFELKYNFNVIDIERNDILKEYKLVSSNQAMTTIQNISDYLEAYFAKLVIRKRRFSSSIDFIACFHSLSSSLPNITCISFSHCRILTAIGSLNCAPVDSSKALLRTIFLFTSSINKELF